MSKLRSLFGKDKQKQEQDRASPYGPPPQTIYGQPQQQQSAQTSSSYGSSAASSTKPFQSQPQSNPFSSTCGTNPHVITSSGGYDTSAVPPPPPGPPPPSSANLPHTNAAANAVPNTGPKGEDPFSALRRYDTVFIVDDSESMEMFWDETRDALIECVKKSIEYDEDGIDMYFFNSQEYVVDCRTDTEVRNLFRRVFPRKSTPTADALRRVLNPYVAKVEASKKQGGPKVKPLSVLVLTDGEPDRGQSPDNVIVDIAKRLDAIHSPLNQLGIQFVQVGQDEQAAKALEELDDKLKSKHGVRDIVDYTMWPANEQVAQDTLLKILQGGWQKKLDKQDGRTR